MVSNKKTWISLAIISVILISACIGFPETEYSRNATIILVRGIGNPRTYTTTTINPDGSVFVYEDGKLEASGIFNETEYEELIQTFEENEFFSLEDRYVGELTDYGGFGSYRNITFKSKSITKTVTVINGSGVAAFHNIVSKATMELVASSRMRGDYRYIN